MEADRRAIGTCGEPAEADAEREAREALLVLGHHSPALAKTFRNLLSGAQERGTTLGDILGTDSELPMDAVGKRAVAVCKLVHERHC